MPSKALRDWAVYDADLKGYFDSSRPTAFVSAHANRGPVGLEADSEVAPDAGGGSAGGEGRHAEGEPSEEGNAAGRSDDGLNAKDNVSWVGAPAAAEVHEAGGAC